MTHYGGGILGKYAEIEKALQKIMYIMAFLI